MEKDLNDAVTMKASLGSKDLAEITEKTQGILKSGELLVEQCADYKTLCEALSKRNQELVKEYQALKLKFDLNESKEEDSVLARNQKVAELESKLEEATKKYDELDFAAGNKMVELNEALEKASKGNAKLDKELGILQSKLKEATHKYNTMKSYYDSELGKLEAKNTELKEALDAKEKEANKFGESIDNVLAQFATLKESNAQLTAEVTKLKEEKAVEETENNTTEEPKEEKPAEDKKPATLEEAVSFKDGGVEGFWNDLHAKYGEAVEPYELKIRGQKTMREAQLAWMGVMNKVDANLKTVQETTFYKNGVISQEQRLHKLHESGMLTSKDVEQDVNEVNARFLAKMAAAGLK
jgi:chromosome segregation ATPase